MTPTPGRTPPLSPARHRPAHLRPGLIALVVLGGTVGAGLRSTLGMVAGTPAQGLATTFAVNVTGAFLLALLLEALSRRVPDARRRALQLTLGTGLLGGFTTYSTLAWDTVALALGEGSALLGATAATGAGAAAGTGPGSPLLAAGYALGTVALGFAAAWAGLATGRALTRAAAP